MCPIALSISLEELSCIELELEKFHYQTVVQRIGHISGEYTHKIQNQIERFETEMSENLEFKKNG